MNKGIEKYKYTWTPTLKWLLTSLGVIYVVIVLLFFLFNFLLKDYMRDIPKEITPWLNNQTVTEQNK
jgi:ABC-type glycerol-3-phosphate transport system permease component